MQISTLISRSLSHRVTIKKGHNMGITNTFSSVDGNTDKRTGGCHLTRFTAAPKLF